MDNDHKPNNSGQLELFTQDYNHEEPEANEQSTQDSIAHHGIAFEIFNRGVVIIGKSGIGKSELGLELVDRGHRLICDDLVTGQLVNGQVLVSAPQKFGVGFMEIRGIGFVNIPLFYGMHALCQQQNLFVVIELVDNSMLDRVNQNRLLQLIGAVQVLGVEIPLYQLPIGANRNLPVLVELIVKYAMERELGYDSHQAFIDQQSDFLLQQGS